jgi:hypothetical protein
MLMGALTLMLGDNPSVTVQMVAAGIGAAGLLLALHLAFVRPWLRSQRLRTPCDVRFVIRELRHVRLPYVIQDHERHIVNELVLPSRSLVDIEFGYKPRVPLQLEQREPGVYPVKIAFILKAAVG